MVLHSARWALNSNLLRMQVFGRRYLAKTLPSATLDAMLGLS